VDVLCGSLHLKIRELSVKMKGFCEVNFNDLERVRTQDCRFSSYAVGDSQG
jgi:hypothetical protein